MDAITEVAPVEAPKSNVKRTYALADFTVEGRGDKWYFWRTARYGDKEEKKGPYGSLSSVTLMIARQLKKDVQKREQAHALPS
jgi:hypothetical protein